MTENTPATRMELLRAKSKRKLAVKGHSLLKRKRDALIRSFFDYVKQYRELRGRVHGQMAEAYDVLHIAQGVSGVNRVKGLAFAARPSFSLEFSDRNLMGVRVPAITVNQEQGGVNASLIGTSYYVKDAYDRFQRLVPDLVKLAELEQVLLKLADEIRATKRRVNALEYIQIPRLEELVRDISARLAEQEREGFTRLKHVKRQLEAQ